MTEIILKKDIDDNKMNALLQFLQSWGVDAVVKKTNSYVATKSSEITLSVGLWSDYENIDGVELRNKAWKRNDAH